MSSWPPWLKSAAALRSWFRQMDEPLFRLALAAMAGILLADRWPGLTGWLAAAFAASVLTLTNRRAAWIFLTVAAAFGSAHLLNLSDPLRTEVERRLQPGNGLQAVVTGVVADAPEKSPWSDSWRFPLRVSDLRNGNQPWPAKGALVYVRITESAAAPVYGDRIVLSGLLRRSDLTRNPGEFDFTSWLKRQGYAAEFFTGNAADRWQVLARGEGNPILAAALRCRAWIARTITMDLEDSPDISATVRAMVLGTREKTPEDIENAFRTSGTMHIFSVSGLHVALFAAVLWFTLSLTPLPRGWIIALSLTVMFFYVFVTGLRPSAWRAAVMVSLLVVAPLWNREGNLFNGLGTAALLLLGWQTQQLFHAGFVLSFGVLLSIALFQHPLSLLAGRVIGPWNAPDPFLPESLRSPRQKSWYWLREKLCLSLGVSTASTIGSMPLMIGYFNLITPVGIIANLLLVTLALWILVIACLSLLSGAAGLPSLVLLWNNANWALAWCAVALAKFFAALPFGHVRVDPARLWRGDPCTLTVLALDHGGGAIRVDTPEGRQWMVDCGGLKHWNRTVRPHLERAPVNRLEGIFLTHADSYHTGALTPLTAQFPPGRVWRAGDPDGKREPAAADRRFTLDPSTTLEVLFPPPGWRAARADDRAAVLRLECRGCRVLLMSDAGFLTEKALLESGADLKADILVMGRNDGDFCGLPEFIRAVNPGALIFTNSRFPEEERAPDSWQKRITAMGITLFDQARTGGVTIRIDRAGLGVKSYLGDLDWSRPLPPPSAWSTLPEQSGPLIR